MRRFKIEIVGITPLILDTDDIDGKDRWELWRKDPANKNLSKPGDERVPEWFWKMKIPWLDGKAVISSEMFNAALSAAASQFILKGNKSFKSTVASSVSPERDGFALKVGSKGTTISKEVVDSIEGTFAEHVATVAKLGFRLYVKRARPSGQTTRHIRVRPRFDEWSFEGTIRVTDDAITVDVLGGILNKMVLGNWRANLMKPGPFGQLRCKLTELRK